MFIYSSVGWFVGSTGIIEYPPWVRHSAGIQGCWVNKTDLTLAIVGLTGRTLTLRPSSQKGATKWKDRSDQGGLQAVMLHQQRLIEAVGESDEGQRPSFQRSANGVEGCILCQKVLEHPGALLQGPQLGTAGLDSWDASLIKKSTKGIVS